MNQILEFQGNRESIKSAYFLIGSLELRLRSVIPITLSTLNSPKISETWMKNLDLSEKGVLTLNRAIVLSPLSPQEFLPFSFWRYLLSSKHYGSLWLPKLHLAFPGISKPKSRESFLKIDKAMDSALRLRNQVAHYNVRNYGAIGFSREKIEWLIKVMEREKAS